MDRLLRDLRSDEDYYAAIRRDEPWITAAGLICQRLGINATDRPQHAAFYSRTPVILVPPGHAVKCYGSGWPQQSAGTRQARGRTLLNNEVAMLKRLERDPALPVPRLIDYGALGEQWSYIVMTSVPGISFESVRDDLPPAATLAAVRWLGAFVRRLHAIPVLRHERDAEWARFASVIEYRASKLPGVVAERRLFPIAS